MSESETRLLAEHMGHDFGIHLKHYALQTNLLERAKVARFLVAAQNGGFSHQKYNQDTVPDVKDEDLVEVEGNVNFVEYIHVARN